MHQYLLIGSEGTDLPRCHLHEYNDLARRGASIHRNRVQFRHSDGIVANHDTGALHTLPDAVALYSLQEPCKKSRRDH